MVVKRPFQRQQKEEEGDKQTTIFPSFSWRDKKWGKEVEGTCLKEWSVPLSAVDER